MQVTVDSFLGSLAPTGFALSIAACFALAGAARAQCSSAWSPGFGHVQVPADVRASARFDDGTGTALYFTTVADENGDAGVWKWDGSSLTGIGLLDGIAFGFDAEGNALFDFDDGTGPALYLAGFFFSVNNVAGSGVVRWDGTSWSPVGQGIVYGNALTVWDDGTGDHLYVGHDGANIARWDGTTWTPVGAFQPDSGWDVVRALTVHDDGTGPALYAGGYFQHVGGVAASNVARFDGSAWTVLGAGTNGAVLALTEFNDGSGSKLYMGGQFTQAGGLSANHVARWDGTSWSALGAGTDSSAVSSLCVFDGGSGHALYAGGTFSTAGGVTARGIARWNGGTWSALGSGVTGFGVDVSTLTVHDDGTGPALFAGGRFETAGGLAAPHLARWRNSGWSRIDGGQGLDGRGRALLVRDEPSGRALYCAGAFHVAGEIPANGVARYDGTSWSALENGLNGEVFALAEYDDGSGAQLVAGGTFSITSAPDHPGIARWDGTSWHGLDVGVQNTGRVQALCVFDDGQGPELYAGGDFTQMAGLPQTKNIARWNGTSWSPVGGGMTGNLGDTTVSALVVWDDGTGPALYVGGYFASAGGAGGPSNLARWQNGTWSSVGSPTGTVRALLPWDDGSGDKLYVAGSLTSIGGVSVASIAAFDGTGFFPVGSGFPGASATVRALTVFDEGAGVSPRLYASGRLGTVGGVANSGLARLDVAGWTSIGTFTNGLGDVYGLAGFDAGDGPGLFAAGSFEFVDSTASKGIGRFASSCPDPVAFCFGTASACPCANAGAPGHGCATSFGAGANLSASGNPSLGNDTLVLAGTGTSNSVLTYFQGTTRVNGGAGAAFGDGLRCAGGSVIRLGSVLASGGLSHVPSLGGPPVSVSGQVTTAGSRRTYQIWFRNAASFCTPSTFNLSNGVEVTWGV